MTLPLIRLLPASDADADLWRLTREVAGILRGIPWVLIGGQMVALIEAEHGASVGRATGDVDTLLDVRDPAASASIGLSKIDDWIGEIDRTQATARYVRQHADVQGLLVPSMGFLDDAARWNVVVYLDRIDPQATFGTPVFLRRIVLDAVGGV